MAPVGLALMTILLLNQEKLVSAQQIPLPDWIYDETCYRRTLLCERYNPSNPTCDIQGGLLGSTGFSITTDNDGLQVNEVEVRGFLLSDSSGNVLISPEIWMTMLDQAELTSSLTPSDNLKNIQTCNGSTVNIRGSFPSNYTLGIQFLCASGETLDQSNAGLVSYMVFNDARCISSADLRNPYILVAVRQGITT